MTPLYKIDSYYGEGYGFFAQFLFPFIIGMLSFAVFGAVFQSMAAGFLCGLSGGFGSSGLAWFFNHLMTDAANADLENCPPPHQKIPNFLAWEEGDKVAFDRKVSGRKEWYFHGVADNGAIVFGDYWDLERSDSAILVSANAHEWLSMENQEIEDREVSVEKAKEMVENSEYMEWVDQINAEYKKLQSEDGTFSKISTSQSKRVNT